MDTERKALLRRGLMRCEEIELTLLLEREVKIGRFLFRRLLPGVFLSGRPTHRAGHWIGPAP